VTDPPPRPTRRAWLRRAAAGLAAGTLASGGCGPGADGLVVACPWPEAEREALAASIRPARVRWVVPSASPDPTRLASAGVRLDAVLGGPPGGYVRLAREGRLAGAGPGWVVARREPAARSILKPGPAPSALGDPRDDPALLAWLRAYLEGASWPVRFAGLARLAASRTKGPDGPPSSLFALPADFCYVEGAAALRDTGREALAARLIAEAASRAGEGPRPSPDDFEDAREGLLADLLGACFVDARAELVSASEAIERHESDPRVDRAAFWMVQPPPWPPASVGVLRAAEESADLVEVLADQVASAPDSRAWLLRSWSGAERPIDGPLLGEIAEADGGRLAREPRFRAWLRGEWLAWARQRYRRAARIARGEAGPA
jgi:hypothetical protein